MEFTPRPAPVAPALEATRRSLREIGVAAVAAALGMVEGAPVHAQTDARMPLPRKAA